MLRKNIFFIILVALAAFSIAGVGAWFSVFGLTKIFAAGWLTFILFGSLEFAKLVVVSFVYRFWTITTFFQRAYLILATIVLMLITSMGIYGFLTNSYQKTASIDKIQNSEIVVYELKKNRFSEDRIYYAEEKDMIVKGISELRMGLSNNVIQYVDSTGRLITTTSSNTRKALQAQLDDAMSRRDNISQKLESVTDSLSVYERKIYELQSSNQMVNELGPLKYLSTLTEQPMDNVVNWLALLIIFVFDPLAIVLIISLNQLISYSGFDPFDGTKSKKKKVEHELKTSSNLTLIPNTVTIPTIPPKMTTESVIKSDPVVSVIKNDTVEQFSLDFDKIIPVIKTDKQFSLDFDMILEPVEPVEPVEEPVEPVEPSTTYFKNRKWVAIEPENQELINYDNITQFTSHINKAQFIVK
jgi:hypothetical protein